MFIERAQRMAVIDGFPQADIYFATVKDCSPVMALPRIKAWISRVPIKMNYKKNIRNISFLCIKIDLGFADLWW